MQLWNMKGFVVQVYEFVWVHMYIHMFEGQRAALGVPWKLSTLFSEQSLHWDLEPAGDRVSLCSPSCLGTHYVDLVGFELSDICSPLPPKG